MEEEVKDFSQLYVELHSWWGEDRNVAESAWVSSMDRSKAEAKSEQDVRRVVTDITAKHHDTPKERLWMDFFITCPIFIERQFDKYRMTLQYQDFHIEYYETAFGRLGITQNELSGRYRTIPDRPYQMPTDVSRIMARAWNGNLNEASYDSFHFQDEWNEQLQAQHNWYQMQLNELRKAERDGFISNVEYKRAREVLRGVLGTGYLTDMRIIMNGNALEHIVNQRLPRDAQMESRVIAGRLLREVVRKNVAPTFVSKLIEVNGWGPLLVEVPE
jgi:thymidylate synthase ThyX